MLPSKFEANPTLRLRLRHASFSLFLLAYLCSNDYYRTYALIDFLANQLFQPLKKLILERKKWAWLGCQPGSSKLYFMFILLISIFAKWHELKKKQEQRRGSCRRRRRALASDQACVEESILVAL